MPNEISLSIRTANDLNDFSVRIDQSDMRLLKILPGDMVVISGTLTCYAIALPALMEDRNQSIIRTNPMLLRNAGALESSILKISVPEKRPETAESITLETRDDIDYLHASAKTLLLSAAWHNRVVVNGNTLTVPTLDHHTLEVTVSESVPKGPVKISGITSFNITTPAKESPSVKLAGLRDAYLTCCNIADKRLRNEVAACAKSVLLTGPKGCGKERLVRRISEEMNIPLRYFDVHALLDKQETLGNTDLENLFSDVTHLAPIIILIDNMEALGNHPSHHILVSQICSALDELRMYKKILMFGVCSGKPDGRFLSNDRFNLVLPIDAPDRFSRQEALTLATSDIPTDESVDLRQLAAFTDGYTSSDLYRLAKTADVCSKSSFVSQNDFTDAMRIVRPTAVTTVCSDVPDVSWHDVGGLDDVKALLYETLSWSLQYRPQFSEFGIRPPQAILISGSQGSGKTLIVRAAAGTIPLQFTEISCPVLASMPIDAANKLVLETFSLAYRKSPCIVFLDDIEVLFNKTASEEESHTPSPVVFSLLKEIDDLKQRPGVILIAATSRPDCLTSDMMRPGRFDYAVMLPQPDAAARKKILQIHASRLPLAADVDFDRLAAMTQGMSSADITSLCNRVGLLALRQSFNIESGTLPPVVNFSLFEQVLRGRKA